MGLRVSLFVLLFASASILSAQAPSPGPTVPKLPNGVALTGTATWLSGGKQDTGNVTLKASLDGSSSEEWDLSSTGKLTWARSALALGTRTCDGVDAQGNTLDLNDNNCWRPVAWFAPWTAPALAAKSFVTTQDVTEQAKLSGLQRMRYSVLLPPPQNPKSPLVGALQRLANDSAVQIDSSSDTALPATLQFEELVAGPTPARLDVTVSFSDYRLEGGFLLPHRIKRYLQHSLQADIQITSVALQ